MRKGEAKGFMAIWADIDAEYQFEFEKWHNCEHMRDRVTIPGFLVGFRYQGIGATPYSLMAYETEDPEVLKSEAYLLSKNNPSPWTRDALMHFRHTERLIYGLEGTAGHRPALQAPYLYNLRFNIRVKDERKAVATLRKGLLAAVASAPGVARARFYRIDEKISGMVTTEQKIYGDGPALKRQFLIMAEMTSPPWRQDGVWRNFRGRTKDIPRTPELLDVGEERYWLRFVMQPPA